MNVVTKEATAAVEPVESTHPNGEFDVILSTDALDRDGERLYIDEWKTPLPDKIHFDSDHGMSVETTVGSGKPRIENGQLRVRGVFAGTPHGQTVRQLVNEGHVTNVSVAFTQSKTRKDAAPQRELLNAAFCAIPANPEAVVLSSKAATSPAGRAPLDTPPEEADQDIPSHDDLVQAIHDAAVHLGADCIDEDTGETDGANKSAGLLAAILKLNKTSGSKSAGSPQESPDSEPADATAATDTKSLAALAEAAEPSADDVALRLRAYFTRKSLERHSDDS